MTDSKNPQTAKCNIETVLSEFDLKEDMLGALCAKTKSLIEASLQDANIPYQSVQARVKTKKKLAEKYLDPKKDYRGLDDITDLAGLRIITYYENDVDRAAEVIEREFDIDRPNSVDKRATEPDRFGYNALNYVCKHSAKRTSDVEYKKFAGVRCEIQITSILRHAWSEMEHEWYDLKDAYPSEVKRRFYRIAALLELAESEFLDIRKSRTQYQRSIAVQVEAKVPDLPVDAVSLRSFIETERLVAEIDQSLATILGVTFLPELTDSNVERRSNAARLAGMTKLQQVRDALEENKTSIPEFVHRCRQQGLWPPASSNQASRGLSIHHLALLVVSLRGTEATLEYLKAMGINVKWDVARQVNIAREINAKRLK